MLIWKCSLAWCELRMIFAYVFREFDIKMVTPRYVLVLLSKKATANG